LIDLGDVGMKMIGEDISFNMRLVNLKLTKNKITDVGFRTLFEYLEYN